MKSLIRAWIAWRYGGKFQKLKPPIGFAPWNRPSLLQAIRYELKKAIWRIESQLHEWCRQ